MNSFINQPKVSVCIVTYNQVEFIGQCLQSVLNQDTNFDFEILVGDDGSLDGTADIVKEFAELYPEKIFPVFHKENIGAQKNYYSVHNIAKGKYIAHIDGDDFCLPGKLQTQADILDSLSQCNIIFHRMLVMKPNGEITKNASINNNSNQCILDFFDRADIIQYMSIAAHSSKMYRASVRNPSQISFDVLDYYFNVEHVGAGQACVITNGYYGVYRLGIGISKLCTTKIMLRNCFNYFSKIYPEYRLQLNTAVLQCLIMDIKNFRLTWFVFFKVWLKTFHILSPLNLWRSRNKIRNLY
jgi:glycosyltransferase involved in cell wall biosynthesis